MNVLQVVDYVLNIFIVAVLTTVALLCIFAVVVLIGKALIDIYYKFLEWRDR